MFGINRQEFNALKKRVRQLECSHNGKMIYTINFFANGYWKTCSICNKSLGVVSHREKLEEELILKKKEFEIKKKELKKLEANFKKYSDSNKKKNGTKRVSKKD